ncbi:aldehyde dehydrogenase family protein, partial [Streptomyces sp. NPDC003691]
VRTSVAAGAAAQPGWADRPAAERAAVLRRAAAGLERHSAEIAGWLVREGGATRAKADSELRAVRDELWAAAALPTAPYGTLLPSDDGSRSLARRVPVGVVGVISPWNFPLLLAVRALAPALALGNAVVLKPDVRTAVSGGVVIARLFQDAGLPPGLLHVLPGGADTGAALTEDPGTDMIAFTGSTAVGREVGATAGRLLKRVSLELGGNNALIVLADADLDAASSAGAWGSFLHQGQVCMTTGRHIVVAGAAEEYTERLVRRAERLTVGDPAAGNVALGPVIDANQLRRIDRIVRDSVAAGAVLRCGGTHDGPFYRPTVLTGVTREMPAFREEIFGPVAPVITVADEEEAVAVARDSEYGLVAAVQTGSAARGLALAAGLRTGIVHINGQTVNDNAFVPFGGRGASGNGTRFGAGHSWDEFTEWQWLTVRETAPQYPF